jgi:hypothetical protein
VKQRITLSFYFILYKRKFIFNCYASANLPSVSKLGIKGYREKKEERISIRRFGNWLGTIYTSLWVYIFISRARLEWYSSE